MPETKHADARALLEVAYRLYRDSHRAKNATGANPESFGKMAAYAAEDTERQERWLEQAVLGRPRTGRQGEDDD